jgi:hypothetical protein
MKEDEVVGKLTSKRLSKALQIIDKALAIFDEEDPTKKEVLSDKRCMASEKLF